MIEISKIQSPQEMAQAFDIRRIVFVIGQNCDPAEEYDEHESSCSHFIAKFNGVPAGVCRIRKTDNGFKLERFAVLEEYRGKQIGAELVKNCLEILKSEDSMIYLHSQEHALNFYAKFGFKAMGDRFWEANIPHFKMIYTPIN